MTIRSTVGALVALCVFASTASGQEVVPLAGKGENIQPIARVNLTGANEVELAGDWAFVSRDDPDAKGPKQGGLAIVNIADPTRPFVQGAWTAADAGLTDASYADVDLSPDGNLAVLTNAHCSSCAEGKVAWVVLIDVTDKANPKLVGKIVDDATMDYVHTSTLDNKTLYTNPQVAAFYPQPGNAHVTVFDVSDPSNPVKKGTISGPGSDAGLAHDSYVDHRPDGKTLMYAASVHKSDVFDISKPVQATWLQSTTSPSYTISHDVQPNHDRSIIIVDDEGAAGGQLDESISGCGKVGSGPASADSGSVHFYKAAPDGTFANAGAVHLGSFNAPTNFNTGACVAHVFWQAPNENRLTQAYYRTGAFVLDFQNPADPKMLGWFLADGGAEYWSNKPHRGYLYATDMDHGLDILRYTGEGGKRWPTTAGPAEQQRAARQGVPYVPVAGAAGPSQERGSQDSPSPQGGSQDLPSRRGASQGSPSQPGASLETSRALGAFRFRTNVRRVPGRAGQRTVLVLTFSDMAGRPVRQLKIRRAAASKATFEVRGVAAAGRYRWTLTAGRKVLRRATVATTPAAGLNLSPDATLAAIVG
jgi:hypothetical protein